jgi:acetyltransferase-like isoleucine patch superfamily enzyme
LDFVELLRGKARVLSRVCLKAWVRDAGVIFPKMAIFTCLQRKCDPHWAFKIYQSYMSNVRMDRTIEHDWSNRSIPANIQWGEGFYCESAQSFLHFKGRRQPAVEIGNHVSIYAASQFAVGEKAHVRIGDFTLLVGALITAETQVEIGSHCLISWGVGIADSDFHPIAAAARRMDAEALAPYFTARPARPLDAIRSRPVRIGNNVWIGMNAIILKGVTVGDNSVIAAGAVVTKDVSAGTVVAGNPARFAKRVSE